MAVRPIVLLGNPWLREVSAPVQEPAQAIPVLEDLSDTLAGFRARTGFGRGISAIQIGVPLRIVFLRVDGRTYEMINPRFTFRSEAVFELWDDCFSFPELMVRLKRHCAVKVAYADRQGAHQELVAEGPLSELIQHEIDHLNGVLAIDHALDKNSFCWRAEFLRHLR